MEDPTDGDNLSTDELVVGKTKGSGLKVTYVTYDYEDILSLQNDTHDVWVYESKMFLTVKESTENKKHFKPQVTEIRPLADKIESVDTTDLVNNDGIEEPTGEFREIKKFPSNDRRTFAEFTDTIQKYINPSGSVYNKENNGIVLVNKYTEEGDNPQDNGVSIRYFGLDEEVAEDQPFIDICYKVVEVKKCEEGTEEVVIVVKNVVTVDKSNPDTNFAGDDLTIGSPDGTPDTEKRVIVTFNVESFDDEKYDLKDVTNAWIHLTFKDFVENGGRDEANPENNILATPLTTTEEFDEDTATWENTNMDDLPESPEEIGTVNVPQEQPGVSPIVVEITDFDVEKLIKEYKGIVLKGVDEPTSPHPVPEFFGKGEEVFPKPALHVCVPKVVTTTSTATPTQTHTPTFTTASTTPTEPPLITNCTIPNGGGRIVIDLKDYLVIQEEPMSPENANYIEIGQTKGKGEKIILVYFDLEKAVETGVIEQFGEPPSDGQEKWDISVTDSKMNFRLTPVEDDNEDAWEPGRPILYPLKKPLDEDSSWSYPWLEGNKGPVPGIDYVSTVSAEFTKLKKRPEIGRWLQATSTTIARYIFTEYDDVKMKNNGFLMRYVTDSGEDATHFLSFDSPALADEEFRPFMDICYVPSVRPIPCTEGHLVWYDLNADTHIARDNLVHGTEDYLYIGNSGWAGKARSLIDFDMSKFNTELTKLHDESESVYLKLHFEGAELSKPYNDPRQMERKLAAHKILKAWNEGFATSKVATQSGKNKNKWDKEMMGELTDYDPEVIATDIISEGESEHDIYFNITATFKEWMDDKSSDHGIMIKDSQHESVPGYFLKFASLDHPDATRRPKLMVCQKKPKCEPEDLEPQKIYNHGCVSTNNVTLNYCVAKNGACTASDGSALDYGYMTGVSALWDDFHILRTFCKCCTDAAADKIQVPMDCEGADRPDYTEEVFYITKCECMRCEEVSAVRKKRATPSKTRLLLRSALKSMLRK